MRKIFSLLIFLLFFSLSMDTRINGLISNELLNINEDCVPLFPINNITSYNNKFYDLKFTNTMKNYKISNFLNEKQASIGIKNDGNRLISVDNPNYDDINPKIAVNSAGTIVVTYEKKQPYNLTTNPIITSIDNGENWNLMFDISSKIFNLAGKTISPNIVYNSNLNVFYYTSIDPDAGLYNNLMGFISGDIENTDDIVLFATSACGDDYLENSAATTKNIFLSMDVRDGYLNKYLDVFYVTYPNFEEPDGIAGVYPDFESVHKTSPASNIEMDTGNRIYLVAESDVDDGPKITIKSTTADEKLLASGEQLNGMDKYADIEQWPGEYIANGSDPDVSAIGNKVYVVYRKNDMIKCSYSTAEDGYEPKFNWQISTVADNKAKCPAIYACGNKIICAFVREGDLFIVTSDDCGASWGLPYKINEVNGTVSEELNSVDVNNIGVVWTDTRNGKKDIYFELLHEDTFIPEISIEGGFGIRILIKNLGSIAKENMWWNVIIDAPFLLCGGVTEGKISLGKYETVEKLVPLFGFGKIKIHAECELGGYANANGFIIGPFVFI